MKSIIEATLLFFAAIFTTSHALMIIYNIYSPYVGLDMPELSYINFIAINILVSVLFAAPVKSEAAAKYMEKWYKDKDDERGYLIYRITIAIIYPYVLAGFLYLFSLILLL